MSVSSTAPNSDFTSSKPLQQSEVQSVFRLKDFVRQLLNDLNREDVAPKGLLLDKTCKVQPVRVIVPVERDRRNLDETALAIRKILSLLKKNLGFLFPPQTEGIDSATSDEFVKLLTKCEQLADYLKLSDVCEDLKKLKAKIDKIVLLIKEKKELFLYRYTDENRVLLAVRLSLKAPDQIEKSPKFLRRCTKVACVEFSQVGSDNKGKIPKELFSTEPVKRIYFPVTKPLSEENSSLFSFQAGLRVKESIYRFICLQSDRLGQSADGKICDVTQDQFLHILDFLLSPKKHPISWDSINPLYDTAQKLGIEKVKDDCLEWLKNEMVHYGERAEPVQGAIFNQVVSWRQDVGDRYVDEYQDFFAEVVRSTKNLIEVLDRLIKEKIGLTHLTFSSAQNLSLSHYNKLSALTTLRKLSLGDRIADQEMKALSALELDELDLNDASHLTEEGFQYLARMTTLKRASVGRLSPYLSDTGLKFLSCLPLSRIDLTRCDLVTNHGLRALEGRITELSFGGAAHLTPAVLASLVNLPLEKLKLFRIPRLVTEDLLVLNSFSNLRTLEIVAANRRGGLDPEKITDLVIPLLAVACPKLMHLRLENVGLANTGMQFFHSLASLEELILSQVSVSSVGSITNLNRLTHLGFLKCDLITGRSLRPLVDMPFLRSLDLMSKQIGDSSLSDILNITQLTSLNLTGCSLSNAQVMKDCLPAGSNLKRLSVSTQFFTIAQGIAPGIVAHGGMPDPEYALENPALTNEHLWKLVLGIKDRIPLDYVYLLLQRDAKVWTPKITEELGKRVTEPHNFVNEDFTKALEMMSWAIDAKSLDLARIIWKLFFEPGLHNYAPLLHNPCFSPGTIGALDTRLVCSVYKQSYAHFLDRMPAPCPLEVMQFLWQKQSTKAPRKEIQAFLAECLKGYAMLFYSRTPIYEEVEELWRVDVHASYQTIGEVSPACLSISNFLGRSIYGKFLNCDITMGIDDLFKQLRPMSRKFSLDRLISSETIIEVVDLIVFAKKYQLEELGRIFSAWLLSCLASQSHLMNDEGLNRILLILKKAKLSQLTLHTEDLPATLPRENLEWWLDKLSGEVLLTLWSNASSSSSDYHNISFEPL